MYYRGCWHIVSRALFIKYRHIAIISYHNHSSLIKEFYTPRSFFIHAASLGQGFPHCRKFPTAASRRSLGRVSVPVWPFNLSVRLRIIDLVSRYLTNYLMRRRSLPQRSRSSFQNLEMPHDFIFGISNRFQLLFPTVGQVTYVLLTRSPLRYKYLRSTCMY